MPAKIRPAAVPAALVGLAAVAILVLAGVVASSGAEAASKVSCGDTITTDTTLHQRPRQLPQQRHRDRRRQRHPRPERPHDRRRRHPCCRLRPGHRVLRLRGRLRRSRWGHREARLGAPVRGRRRRLRRPATPACSASPRRGTPSAASGSLSSARILVRNCSGNRSTAPEGNGLGLFDSHHIRVLNSSFRHNVHAGIKPVGSTNSLIKGNLVAQQRRLREFSMEGGEGFRVQAQPPRSKRRRHHARPRQPQRDHPKPRLARPRRHPDREGTRQPGRAQRRRSRPPRGHPPRNHASLPRRRAQRRPPKSWSGTAAWTGSWSREGRPQPPEAQRRQGAGDDGFDIEQPLDDADPQPGGGNGDLGIEAVRGVNDGGGNSRAQRRPAPVHEHRV